MIVTKGKNVRISLQQLSIYVRAVQCNKQMQYLPIGAYSIWKETPYY